MNVYTEDLLTPEPWVQDARCTQSDPDAWFPEPGFRGARYAKSVCRECPVAAECAAFAVRTGQRDGIWGGLNGRQISRIRGEAA